MIGSTVTPSTLTSRNFEISPLPLIARLPSVFCVHELPAPSKISYVTFAGAEAAGAVVVDVAGVDVAGAGSGVGVVASGVGFGAGVGVGVGVGAGFEPALISPYGAFQMLQMDLSFSVAVPPEHFSVCL